MEKDKVKKKYFHPTLTKEASEALKQFYLETRNKSLDSVSLRDYESLLRFAEDSARGRNNQKVTVEDVKKAIDIWFKEKTKQEKERTRQKFEKEFKESAKEAYRRKKKQLGIV